MPMHRTRWCKGFLSWPKHRSEIATVNSAPTDPALADDEMDAAARHLEADALEDLVLAEALVHVDEANHQNTK